eukprot:1159302-Pelagomonas_calceolata.AAC.13
MAKKVVEMYRAKRSARHQTGRVQRGCLAHKNVRMYAHACSHTHTHTQGTRCPLPCSGARPVSQR